MSALALEHDAVNLGQGFPDTDGPTEVLEAAREAISAGHNQYPPGPGIPQLREAVAVHQARHYGLSVDPATEVLVTAGATEALAAACLALTGPGDEILTLDPCYDAYPAGARLSGARLVAVGLAVEGDGFALLGASLPLYLADDNESALAALDLLVGHAQRSGQAWAYCLASSTRALVHHWTGDLVEALADAQSCYDVLEQESWTGSMTTQATWSAPTCVAMLRRARSAACSPVIPSGSRNGYDIGTRYTSPANGPKPRL